MGALEQLSCRLGEAAQPARAFGKDGFRGLFEGLKEAAGSPTPGAEVVARSGENLSPLRV